MAVCITHFSLNSSEIASWVQAIGSIAAIWGAFTVSNTQVKRQIAQKVEEDKRKAGAHFAVVKSAAEHTKALWEIARQGPDIIIFDTIWKRMFSDLFDISVSSLKQLPAHEMGSYDLVVNYISIAGAMANIATRVRTWQSAGSLTQEHGEIMFRDLEVQFHLVAFSWGRFQEASVQ
jgi:hypothetical protein